MGMLIYPVVDTEHANTGMASLTVTRDVLIYKVLL